MTGPDLRAERRRRPSLYVHVPFCVQKCAYCDFASMAGSNDRLHADYVEAVLRHLDGWLGTGVFVDGAETVYIGGGTPTLLGGRLLDLVEAIESRVTFAAGTEFTVETNPDTTDPYLVSALVAAGVTRFSLGVQSFDDEVLGYLGRCHDAASAEHAAKVLDESGAAFSVDLICGVPAGSAEGWRSTVRRAIATGAGHVSVYPLAVEEGTRLSRAIEGGRAAEPDQDAAAAEMIVACEELQAAGFSRYEVANYARPGRESVHNLGYWTRRPYVGIGPSAAGMLTLAGERLRFSYPREIQEWLASDFAGAESEFLGADEAACEDLMLALRLVAGASDELVHRAGRAEAMADLAARRLVERTDDGAGWRTTQAGWLLGNEVFERALFG